MKNRIFPRSLATVAVLMLCSFGSVADTVRLDQILGSIEQLEKNNEPKCYATASRLEDFMFGTPLSDEARFEKNQRQQQWLQAVWLKASEQARSEGLTQVGAKHIYQRVKGYFDYALDEKGHWVLKLGKQRSLKIHKDDKRQYGSIAYSLRAILAVQQQNLLAMDDKTLPLAPGATDELSKSLDLLNLAVLKVADENARRADRFEIEKHALAEVWTLLTDTAGQTEKPRTRQLRLTKPKLLMAIVEQKVRSYAKYNQISNSLFVRNLQVYFARNRWPADEQTAKAFRGQFTESLIAFSADLYFGAQGIAIKQGREVITEADVHAFTQQFIPHRINEYEDAIFFPNLERESQVVIESYDMDAFRDSGIHWRYLQFAVTDPDFKVYLEPDPFAAELLVENIAQFGVLLLRMIGDEGKKRGEKRITLEHFAQAAKTIQDRINRHATAKPAEDADDTLVSSKTATKPAEGNLFTDVTAATGIDLMHRSSDWLNRLLRSYLDKGNNTATMTIPPAFGGAGVATRDINGDGLTDVLLLSGLGNRLYANRGNGKFEDITVKSGLQWRRPQDNQPGEPRQPLIADLDNDGLQDIVITYVNDVHRVYRNLGNEKFADVTDTAGLGGTALVGGPATVFDYDNDGLLDIYITYFGNYLKGVLPTLERRNFNGLPNRLFRNTGNFTFKDVTEGSGLDNSGWGQAVSHTDLDGDGLQDLIVGNDFGVNGYYRNLGNGKFENIADKLGTDKPSYTMGIGIADLNDDDRPDIYISNIVTMNKDEKYIMPEKTTTMKFNPDKMAKMRVVEANDLFLSGTADNTVSYRLSQAVGRGYSSTGWAWDADFFDVDNDGDDDLYVLNGMNEFNLYSNENPYYTDPLSNKAVDVYIPVSTKESNVMFVNEGGKLNNVSRESGADLVGNSRSAAYFDIEGDGDLDMILNNYHDKAVVYRNNSEKSGRHWLKVRLKGAPEHKVNLDAVGARILVTTKDGEKRWREVHGSIGYMSVHPLEQHFGLAGHQTADITIRWPNGKIEQVKGVKANQTLVVDYGKAAQAVAVP